jgi:hypothetical protein
MHSSTKNINQARHEHEDYDFINVIYNLLSIIVFFPTKCVFSIINNMIFQLSTCMMHTSVGN